ncbi:helix-turn-helix transcriptional regulator [Cryobacterium sp. Y57]|uniref:helix-turn-helix domain-containing protein n=1 Tax=Cryobacterium sp. Y57 TaxID=2048287 RepID=UPI000CE48BA3|nr:helix-turn-helix transcriptional regulator [Cryobacterium sp. Y57]
MTIYNTAADVAARITKARKDADRTGTWLSMNSGISEKTLSRRFAAPEQFTLAELSAIARVLNCDFDEILIGNTAALAA